jgi:hypothetical protein
VTAVDIASEPQETSVGRVTHYFGHIQVAAIDLTESLHVGDKIHIRGHSTDFVHTVDSMQVEHKDVTEAGPGASVGVKVPQKVHEGDEVLVIS